MPREPNQLTSNQVRNAKPGPDGKAALLGDGAKFVAARRPRQGWPCHQILDLQIRCLAPGASGTWDLVRCTL